jgi:thiamine transport system ATP-binding protein
LLTLDKLQIDYPGWNASFDLVVPKGSLCALIGPSGGGKTTLLHMIAGFIAPKSGTLSFAGRDLQSQTPAQRPLSILFQEHNLFPHLSASDNVGLGLHPALKLNAEQRASATEALERVGLAGHGSRRPGELSGGQRQRVALARALVRQRPLMLLDEPFSGLDPGLRVEMIGLVDSLRRQEGLTVMMSLHTPTDAAEVADQMVFIDEGRVVASGRLADLTASRAHPAINRYFGPRNRR